METYSERLTQCLGARHEVEVLALPGRLDGSPPSVWKLIAFGVTTTLRLLMSGKRVDVTHIGDMACWILGLVAYVRSGGVVVLSAHGTDVSYPLRKGVKGRLYGAYLKAGSIFLRKAIVIANSQATADATKQFGFSRVVVVPLAADLSNEAEAPPCEGHILFVGRLVPRKGCAWFIENVLGLLPDEMTLRVVGTLWSPAEARALGARKVRYMGPLRGRALRDEYACALCVVIPNIDLPNGEFEGFGLTATEAAACGGIPIASRHGGLIEAVIDGETGFLLPASDPAAWVRMISAIRGWEPSDRQAFLHRSRELIKERYSWERVARETLAAYGPPSFQ